MAKRNKFNQNEFRSVCAAVRTYWLVNKKIPDLDQLNSICDVAKEKIAKVLVTEDFLEAMDDTGIPVRTQKGLNMHQHYALVIMTDPNDKRPHHTRLKEAGISTVQWKAWLRNPIFASFLENFYESALDDHMNAAHLSLMNQVDKGNTRAIELYYAMTGRYSANSQQERDVQAVVSGLLEILQRKLDPKLLAEVSEEVAVLMGRKKELPAYRSEQVEEVNIVDAEEVKEEYSFVHTEEDPEYSFVHNKFAEDILTSERLNKYASEGWEVSDKEKFLDNGGAAASKPVFDTSAFDNN